MFHVEHTQEELLRSHLQWVLETNKIHNLTAITDEDEAWRLHVLDSLAVLPEMEAAPPGPLLDIGSGAGFPGVPLGIMSGRDTVCLDSVKKKSEALRTFLAGDARMNHIRTEALRAEELALALPAHFAVVVARAVAPLPSLVELASPLLMIEGVCVCLKAKVTEEELAAGTAAAQHCGMVLQQVRNYLLEDGDETRCVVEYRKASESSVPLPRRTGMAQKRPLR